MVWNTIVWLMLVNFFAKIVTSTAQNYLRKQQELELNKKKLSSTKNNWSFKANGTASTWTILGQLWYPKILSNNKDIWRHLKETKLKKKILGFAFVLILLYREHQFVLAAVLVLSEPSSVPFKEADWFIHIWLWTELVLTLTFRCIQWRYD